MKITIQLTLLLLLSTLAHLQAQVTIQPSGIANGTTQNLNSGEIEFGEGAFEAEIDLLSDGSLRLGTGASPSDLNIMANGFIGIGTTSPDQELDIFGDIALTDGTGRIEFKEGSTVKSFINWSGSTLTIQNDETGIFSDIQFNTNDDVEINADDDIMLNAADDITLDVDGDGEIFLRNVGALNTGWNLNSNNSVSLGLTVSENAKIFVRNGPHSVGVWSDNDRSSSSDTWGLFASADGSGTGHRNGVHGISPSSPGFGVLAGGDLGYTGSLVNASDRKLKKNITGFEGLETIMRLKPKTYEFKTTEYREMYLTKGKRYGFIAQQLREVLPELVKEKKYALPAHGEESGDGYSVDFLGVDYVSLVPILTQAIQEQQNQIEEKNQRITELEQQQETFENRLANLETLLSQNTLSASPETTVHLQGSDQPRLEQNAPNPFNGETQIQYYLPEITKSAQLRIADAKGQLLKILDIQDTGEGQLTLTTSDLPSGSYQYTLVIDGKVFSTKQMVLTK